MVNLTGDNWNTLEGKLIYIHSRLSNLGFMLVNDRVIYPATKDKSV